MPTYSPQVSIGNVNPPFVGIEPLKWRKANIEYACRPPVSLSADSGPVRLTVTSPQPVLVKTPSTDHRKTR